MFPSGWRFWLKRLSSSSAKRRRRGGASPRRREARLGAELLETRLAPATFTWDGGGITANWSNGANWVGDIAPAPGGRIVNGQTVYDDLVFPPGVLQLTAVNDFRNAIFNSITISGGGYTLGYLTSPEANAVTLGTATPGSGYVTMTAGGLGASSRITLDLRMGGAAGNRQFFSVDGIASSLEVAGRISGQSGVTLSKQGIGTLILSADNSNFTGPVTVVQGPLRIQHRFALGNTLQPTTVETNAQVQVDTVTGTIPEPLLLNGPGPQNDGALLNYAGDNTWSGRIELDSNTTLGARTDTNLVLQGQITDLGAGHSLTKEGRGRVVLDPLGVATGNVYRGQTFINDGTLGIRHSLALGEGGSSTNNTVVNSTPDRSGTLEIEYVPNIARIDPNANATIGGFTVPTELLTLNGPGREGTAVPVTTVSGALNNKAGNNSWSSGVTLGSGAAIGAEINTNLTIDGVVGGGGGFNKVRQGRVIFTNANTYGGFTNIVLGYLTIRDSRALGGSGNGTAVQNGGALELQADAKVDSVTGTINLQISNEDLTINGPGANAPPNTGALRNLSGTNTWTGDITLAGDAAIGVEPDPDPLGLDSLPFNNFSQLTVSGIIGGGSDLSKVGQGELILTRSNNYTGETFINEGWVTIRNSNALGGRIAGLADTLQPGTTIAAGAGLHLRANPGNSLTITENITLSGTGISHRHSWLNNKGAIVNLVGDNTITGDLVFGLSAGIGVEVDGVLTAEPTQLTLTGSMSEPTGVQGGLVKLGSRRLIVKGDGTYSGLVDVQEGVLRIHNDTALGTATTGTIVRNGAALEMGISNSIGGIIGGIQVIGESLQLSGPGSSALNVATWTNVSSDNLWRGPVSLVSSVTIDTKVDSRLLVYGTISDTANTTPGGSAITKNGLGKLFLAGSNTYRGQTTVNQGTITLANGQALGSPFSGTVVAPGANLETQGDFTVAGEPVTLQGQGPSVAANLPLRWFAQGPAPILNGQTLGNEPVTGRLTGVAVDPSDPNVIYISAAGGGAWKTKNGGRTWTPLTDNIPGATFQTMFTGAIAISRTDPRVIYLATGEANNSGDSFYGRGIYKSTDSGQTWVLIGNNELNRRTVSKIVVDPIDSDTIYVAASASGVNGLTGNTGVWRYDGTTWTNLITIASPARLANTPPLGPGPDDDTNITFNTTTDVSDLVVVDDPNTLRPGNRFIAFAYGAAGGSGMNAVYTSVNGGRAWNRNSFPTGTETINGSPTFRNGNIKLTITGWGAFTPAPETPGPTTPITASFTMYASIAYPTSYADPALAGAFREIQKTTITWSQANFTNPAQPPDSWWVVGGWAATTRPPAPLNNYMGTQGWYNQTISVNPTNANEVYAAGLGQPFTSGPIVSRDGGQTWVDIGIGSDGRAPHVDYHASTWDNAPTPRLLLGNDGGLWRLDNPTSPLYTQLNGNLAITQFNGLAGHPFDPFFLVGGSQDNGTEIGNGALAWSHVEDGDGGVVRIDPRNPNVMYHVLNGTLRRSFNGGIRGSWQTIYTVGGLYFPFIIDPINTSRLLIGDGGSIVETLDQGISFINLGGPGGANGLAVASYQGPYQADPGFPQVPDRGDASYDPDTIYIVSGAGVSVTKNHGVTWLNRSTGLPGGLNDIAVDPRNRDVAYVVKNSFGGGKVFKTTDAGQTWTNITGNLPDLPTWKVAVHSRTGDVFIGNDNGVWLLTNPGTNTWQRFNDTLPNVQVREMFFNPGTDTLVVGTYGRSAFQLWLDYSRPNPGVLRAISGTSVWTGPITLTGDTFLGAEAGGQLTLLGPISDASPVTDFKITKIGGGRVVLAGANSYGGSTLTFDTEVREGTLAVRNSSALGSPISGTHVLAGATLEVQSDVTAEPLLLTGDGTRFNGHNAGALRNVSNFNTYSGPITLNSNVTIGVDSGSQLTITGTITDNGNNYSLTKELTGTLVLAPVTSNIYGGQTDVIQGALSVQRPGSLGLTTGITRVYDGARLELQGNVTVSGETLHLSGTGFARTGALFNAGGNNTWQGPITLTQIPGFSPTTNPGFEVSIGGGAKGNTLTINGPIGQSGGTFALTKVGLVTTILSQANSYGGLTNVQEGILALRHPSALGAAGSNANGTRVFTGATLRLESVSVTNERLFLNGNGVDGLGALHLLSGAQTWAGPVTLESNTSIGVSLGAILTLSNGGSATVIDPTPAPAVPASLTKVGAGPLILATTNTYQGATFVNEGFLAITNNTSLGTPAGAGTTVASGATLDLLGSITVTGEALTLSGQGVSGVGAIRVGGGTSTWQGPVTLADDSFIGTFGSTDVLIINQPISDANRQKGVTKVGQGTLTYGGGAGSANAYTGLTRVNDGTLVLGKAPGEESILNDVVVGDGTGPAGSARLRWISSLQMGPFSRATVHADGLIDLNGQTDLLLALTMTDGAAQTGAAGSLTVNNLTMTGGQVTIGPAGQLVLTGDVVATSNAATGAAVVTGPGQVFLANLIRFTVADGPAAVDLVLDSVMFGPLEVIKDGPGTAVMTQVNTYTAQTTVTAGRLLVDGRIGDVLIQANGTLGGIGTVGNVTSQGGTVAPGDSPGVLTVAGNLTLDNQSTLRFELDGTAAGNGAGFYDQLVVTGTVELGGARLVGDLGHDGAIGDTYTILTAETLIGTFAQGTQVFVGDKKYSITYDTASNPDRVVLTRVKTASIATLSSSANPSVFGQPVTITATMTSETGVGVPSGMVRFTIAGSSIDVAIDPVTGTASFNPSTLLGFDLSPGDYTVSLSYVGDSNFEGTNTTLTQTIRKADVNRAFSVSPDPLVFGQAGTLTVTLSPKAPGAGIPSGQVIIRVDGSDRPAQVLDANGQASISLAGLSADLHRFDVRYLGDGNFNSFTFGFFSDFLYQVNKANTAVAQVTADRNPIIFGEAVTFSARVTAVAPGAGLPTGTVTFLDGTSPLGTGTIDPSTGIAIFTTTTALTGGTHSITARYGGDSSFNGSDSSSTPFTLTVDRSTTRTGVSVLPSPSVYGQLFTMSASVVGNPPGLSAGKPTGTVTFFVDGIARGTRQMDASGLAVLSIPILDAGTHAIEARYDGDNNFAVSTGTTTHTVDKAATTTSVTTSVTPSVFGQEVTFRAAIAVVAPGSGTPGGTVTFFIDGVAQPPQPLIPSGFSFFKTTALTAGQHTIVARYDGDGNFNGSTSLPITQQVNKADAGFVFTPTPTTTVYGQPVTFTVTIGARAPGAGTPTGQATVKVDGVTRAPAELVNGQLQFSLTNLTAGVHRFDVSYSGDANFNAFEFGAFTDYLYSVNKANTALTQVTSSRNPSVFGEAVTFTTTVGVVAPGAGVPTGTVLFLDGTQAIGQATIDASGIASFTTTTALTGGTHLITARYGGDTNFNGSNTSAVPLTQTVNPSGTTTSVVTSPSPSVPGQVVTVTATVVGNAPGNAAGVPTGTVTFALNGVTLRTVALNGVGKATITQTLSTVGTYAFTATYNGDGNFGSSLQTVNHEVQKFTANVGVTSSINPAALGQAVTFTARVTRSLSTAPAPTGSVTFFVNGVQQGSPVNLAADGTATFTTSSLVSGQHTVRADYSGDANYKTASGSVTQTVTKLGTTTSLSAPTPNPSVFGQGVTLTATVTPSTTTGFTPSGTVSFLDGNTVVAQATLNASGVAQTVVTNLAVGTRSLKARYDGDTNFNPSTSSAVSQVINRAATAVTTLTSSVNPSVYGQGFTLTATVQAVAPGAGVPTGTVTFRAGTTTLGQAPVGATGQAAFTVTTPLDAGTHAITATYDGDGNFNPSPASAVFTQTINAATTALALSSLANPSVYGQAAVVATVTTVAPGTGVPTGTVTFVVNGSQTIGPVTLDSNGVATLTPTQLQPGAHTITASFSGSTNFRSSTSVGSLSQTVNKASTTTVITSSANPSFAGQAVTFTATVAPAAPGAGTVGGTVTFVVDGVAQAPRTVDTNGQAQLTLDTLTVGNHTISATYAGDSRFNGSASPNFSQVVQRSATQTALAVSPTGPVSYGTSVTLTAQVSVVAPGAGTPTGTVTFLAGTQVLQTVALNGTTATFTTSALNAGTHQLTARYDGSATHAGSTSSPSALTVNRASTSLSLALSRNVAVRGRNITLTATVTPSVAGAVASGTVTFLDGGTPIGQGTVSGNRATLTTSFAILGTRNITATYGGDTNLAGSNAGPVSLLVGTLNQAWVAQTYLDLFGRQVDAGGLAYWSGLLDSGALSAYQIVQQLENTPEYRTFQVDQAYRTYLRRPADPGALATWVPFLQQGNNIMQLRAILLGSQEYFNGRGGGTNVGFLNALAQDVLGRTLDPNSPEFGYLLFLLQQFTPRSAIATNLMLQTEAVNRQVNGLFQTYLRRSADPNGLNWFTSFIQGGGTEEQVIAQLISSSEYFDKL